MSQRDAPHHSALVVSSTIKTTDGRPIQLYCFDLDRLQVSDIDSLACEKEQAGRFHFARDGERFLVRRAVFRSLVAELNELEVTDVQLVTENGERPWIRGLSDFEFNASHSGSSYMVATSVEAIPGIDVELEREIPDLDSVVKRICTPEECDQIGSADRFSSKWFLELWTRKEAVMKGLGLGLKLDPDRITIPVQKGALEAWSPVGIDGSGEFPSIEVITPTDLPDETICSLAVQVMPSRS